jgi:hypothetical protein
MGKRAADDGITRAAFSGEVLVVCPQCSGCVVSRRQDPAARGSFAPRRAACSRCGFNSRWEGRHIAAGALRRPVVDDYFGLELWLQAPCAREVLWAYNHRHLAKLEEFVAASLRERRTTDLGWRNSSLHSRLPRWMKLAKNRDAVLRTIARLKHHRRTA